MSAALQGVESLSGRQRIHHYIHVERRYRVVMDNSRQPYDRKRAAATKKGQMKTDLEEAFGTSGHPKADLLFKLAWEYGMESGHESILDYYDEMKDLIL